MEEKNNNNLEQENSFKDNSIETQKTNNKKGLSDGVTATLIVIGIVVLPVVILLSIIFFSLIMYVFTNANEMIKQDNSTSYKNYTITSPNNYTNNTVHKRKYYNNVIDY